MAKQEKHPDKNQTPIEKSDKSNFNQDRNIQNNDWSRKDDGYKPIRDTADPNPPTEKPAETK